MKINKNLPNKISVFPLSNFIIFPKATVPLNIFEERYIEMVDDSMRGTRMIGMIQPKKTLNNSVPELYEVGCLGRITSFNETEEGKYFIIINGLNRFKIVNEISNNKLYREFNVSYDEFENDEKLNDEDKAQVNEKLDALKKAKDGGNVSDMKKALEELSGVWSQVATKIYDANDHEGQQQEKPSSGNTNNKKDKNKDEIEDADFEVVD